MKRKMLVGIGILFALPFSLSAQDLGPVSALHCPRIDHTLQFASRDSATSGQVSELQRFLSDWYDLDPSVYVTGYFGRLTRENIRRFQCERMNICSGDEAVGWGVVGPRTRAAILSACAGGSTSPFPPSPTPQGTPAPSPSPAQTSLPLVSISLNGEEYVELDPRVIYTLRYGSSNASSCKLSQSFGNESPTTASIEANTQGSSQGLVPLEGSVTYTLTCMNPKGSSTKSVTAKRKPGAPCSLGGTTVQDRETGTFYAQSSVLAPQSCDSQSRTCNDGTLTGNPQYTYASCTVTSPTPSPSPTPPTPSPTPAVSSPVTVSCSYKGTSYGEGQFVTDSGLSSMCDNGVWLITNSSIGGQGISVCNYTKDTSWASLFGCSAAGPGPLFGVTPRHGTGPFTATAIAYVGGWSFYTCKSHTINWGDGATESFPRTSECANSATVIHTHTYTTKGSHALIYSDEFGTAVTANIRVD